MSFAVFQQASPSTVIDACLFSSFTSGDATNLILSRGDRLEVYDVRKSKLSYAFAVPLCGRPEAVSVFRPRQGSADHIAVVLRRARYLAVLKYDPEFAGARTCGQHMLIATDDPANASGPCGLRPQIAVDPECRCLAVRTLRDRVIVFPVSGDASWQQDAGPAAGQHSGLAFHQDADHPPGLRAPFTFSAWTPLRLNYLEDVAFLHGYHQPTAACLGRVKPAWGGCLNESNKCNCSVIIVAFDLVDKAPHLIWAVHSLPHDIFQVVPLKLPVGGMFLLSKNAVLYVKEHGPSFCQTLNPAASIGDEFAQIGMEVKDETRLSIVLAGCSVVALSPTVLLVSIQPTGRLYLAHLVLASRDVVTDVIWTSPCTAAPVVDICTFGEEFVFLAAPDGASSLLKVQQSKKKLPQHLQPSKRARVDTAAENGTAAKATPDAAAEKGAAAKTTQDRQDGADSGAAEEGKDKGAAREDAEGGKRDTPVHQSELLKELLKLNDARRDAARYIRSYNFVVADELQSVGAILSLANWWKDKSAEQDEGEGAAACGTERFICAGGSGTKGALHIFQRAIPMECLTEFDLPAGHQFSAVWTVGPPGKRPMIVEVAAAAPAALVGKRAHAGDDEAGGDKGAADDAAAAGVTPGLGFAGAAPGLGFADGEEEAAEHRYVLISGASKTMVLETTDSIEEISESTPLDTKTATICAGNVLSDRLTVQLTPERMCFMWTHDPRAPVGLEPLVFASRAPGPVAGDVVATAGEGTGEGAPGSGAGGSSSSGSGPGAAVARACDGSICDPYVLARFDDLGLRLFAVSGEERVDELSHKLPESVSRPVLCASICRSRTCGLTLLVVATPQCHGTVRILDLGGMEEVFCARYMADVPPVLRNACGGAAGCDSDHLRSLSDVCAPLSRGAGETQAAQNIDAAADAAASAIVSVELVEVGADDRGPTLVAIIVGRPILLYRSSVPFSRRGQGEGARREFPRTFSLHEHDFIGPVDSHPLRPYRPVAAWRHPGASSAGAVVVPPHANLPALWLAAQRNQLFVHPLPSAYVRAFAPLHAPCCEGGFFALSQAPSTGTMTGQVYTLAKLEGFPEDQPSFDLQGPIPCARKLLQQTPRCIATHPQDEMIAVAVSEYALESSDASGPNLDEDPLGEDLSIIRAPPMEVEPPPMPRLQSRYELWIDHGKDLAKLGQYNFSFDNNEQVLCLAWVTLAGFPSPSLAVGTGVNTGEDLTCRGRVLIFSIKDRDPGIVPAMFQRSLKTPATVVGQRGSYFVHSEGYKLFFERWENGTFTKVAVFDGSVCITAMSSIKNFLLFGDLRKGIDFVQWKEEAASQTRSLRRLSRSPPSMAMTVLACEFVVHHKSLGLVALDSTGSAHLYQYSPHSDGREGDQLLRSCATFAMGFPCRAALRLQLEPGIQSLLMASAGGELLCLKPIDDQAYRTVTTLLGMLATRLPFRCGLNPRAFRHHDGPPSLIAPRKNIEDASLLRLFAFLSTPLQTSVAEKMRLPIAALMKATLPSATCQLYMPKPAAAGK